MADVNNNNLYVDAETQDSDRVPVATLAVSSCAPTVQTSLASSNRSSSVSTPISSAMTATSSSADAPNSSAFMTTKLNARRDDATFDDEKSFDEKQLRDAIQAKRQQLRSKVAPTSPSAVAGLTSHALLLLDSDGKLTCPKQAALQLCEHLAAGDAQHEVYVVGIVGAQGEGKSMLLNAFAKRTIFASGHLARQTTEGVSYAIVPHPRRANASILLCDTQGAGPHDDIDKRLRLWVMLAAHAVVYNFKSTPGAQMPTLRVIKDTTDVAVGKLAQPALRDVFTASMVLVRRDCNKDDLNVRDLLAQENVRVRHTASLPFPSTLAPSSLLRTFDELRDNNVLTTEFTASVDKLWNDTIIDGILESATPLAVDDVVPHLVRWWRRVCREDIAHILVSESTMMFDRLLQDRERELARRARLLRSDVAKAPLPRQQLDQRWGAIKRRLNTAALPASMSSRFDAGCDEWEAEIQETNRKALIDAQWAAFDKMTRDTLQTYSIDVTVYDQLVDIQVLHTVAQINTFGIAPNAIMKLDSSALRSDGLRKYVRDAIAQRIDELRDRVLQRNDALGVRAPVISFDAAIGLLTTAWMRDASAIASSVIAPSLLVAPQMPELPGAVNVDRSSFVAEKMRQVKYGGGSNAIGGRKMRRWHVLDSDGKVIGEGKHGKYHSQAQADANAQAQRVLDARYQEAVARAENARQAQIAELQRQYAAKSAAFEQQKAKIDAEYNEQLQRAEAASNDAKAAAQWRSDIAQGLIAATLLARPHLIHAFVNYDTIFERKLTNASGYVLKESLWSAVPMIASIVAGRFALSYADALLGGFVVETIATCLVDAKRNRTPDPERAAQAAGWSVAFRLLTSTLSVYFGGKAMMIGSALLLVGVTVSDIRSAIAARNDILRNAEVAAMEQAVARALEARVPFDDAWSRTLRELGARLLAAAPTEWPSLLRSVPLSTRLVEDKENDKQWRRFDVHSLNTASSADNTTYVWLELRTELARLTVDVVRDNDARLRVSIRDEAARELLVYLLAAQLNDTRWHSRLIAPLAGMVLAPHSEPRHSAMAPPPPTPTIAARANDSRVFVLREHGAVTSLLNVENLLPAYASVQERHAVLGELLAQVVVGYAQIHSQGGALSVGVLTPECIEIAVSRNVDAPISVTHDGVDWGPYAFSRGVFARLSSACMRTASFAVPQLPAAATGAGALLDNDAAVREQICARVAGEAQASVCGAVALQARAALVQWDLHMLFRRLAREPMADAWRHALVGTFWALEERARAAAQPAVRACDPLLDDADELLCVGGARRKLNNDLTLSVPLCDGVGLLTAEQFAKELSRDDFRLLVDGPAWPPLSSSGDAWASVPRAAPPAPPLASSSSTSFIELPPNMFDAEHRQRWLDALRTRLPSDRPNYTALLFPSLPPALVERLLAVRQGDAAFLSEISDTATFVRCRLANGTLVALKCVHQLDGAPVASSDASTMASMNDIVVTGNNLFHEAACALLANELPSRHYLRCYGVAIGESAPPPPPPMAAPSLLWSLFSSSSSSRSHNNNNAQSTPPSVQYGFVAYELVEGHGSMVSLGDTIRSLQRDAQRAKLRVPLRDEYIHNATFQVAMALRDAQTRLQFMHNQLHLGNVILQRCDDTSVFFPYDFDNERYRVPNLGFVVKIVDLSVAKMTVRHNDQHATTFVCRADSNALAAAQQSARALLETRGVSMASASTFAESFVTTLCDTAAAARSTSETNDLHVLMNMMATFAQTARNAAVRAYAVCQQQAHYAAHGDVTGLDEVRLDKQLLDVAKLHMSRSADNALTTPTAFARSAEFALYRVDRDRSAPLTLADIRATRAVLVDVAEAKLLSAEFERIRKQLESDDKNAAQTQSSAHQNADNVVANDRRTSLDNCLLLASRALDLVAQDELDDTTKPAQTARAERDELHDKVSEQYRVADKAYRVTMYDVERA